MKVQLNDVLTKRANTAIITMVREANRKGGYMDVLTKLRDKETGLAAHIYGLAKSASQMGRGKVGDDSPTLDWFLAMCRASEAHLKAVGEKELGHKVENVKDELPCWPVFKSEIKRAITLGLDPASFETYGALQAARKAKEEQASRQAHHNETGGEGEAGEGGEGGTNVAAGVTGKTKVTPTLAATLTVMQKRIEGMTDEQQDAFAERLSAILADFADEDAEPAEVASGAAQEAAPEAEEDKGLAAVTRRRARKSA